MNNSEHNHQAAERKRLDGTDSVAWKRWGTYLSERQWGTVREDYSADGDCWRSFSHDQARSRAYRWGEDGLLGICDDQCRLCFALALWNGKDPILKERLFGLAGPEGNHGEDVKEHYFYLDSTPTHSYMRAIYKYPIAPYPYSTLVQGGARSRSERELELEDAAAQMKSWNMHATLAPSRTDPAGRIVVIRVEPGAPNRSSPTPWTTSRAAP